MTGPCYGERGRMTERGGKIQCHVCGLFFDGLCTHVRRRHDLTPDDYRREFLLPRELGLVSSRLHLSMRLKNGANLKGRTKRRDAGDIYETKCRVCHRPMQLRPRARSRVVCSQACRIAERVAQTAFKPGVPQPQTPTRVAARQRNAEARRAKYDAIRATRVRTCAHCGAEFRLPRPSSQKRTCSARCRAKFFNYLPPWQRKDNAPAQEAK